MVANPPKAHRGRATESYIIGILISSRTLTPRSSLLSLSCEKEWLRFVDSASESPSTPVLFLTLSDWPSLSHLCTECTHQHRPATPPSFPPLNPLETRLELLKAWPDCEHRRQSHLQYTTQPTFPPLKQSDPSNSHLQVIQSDIPPPTD